MRCGWRRWRRSCAILLQRTERPLAESSSNRATVLGNIAALIIGFSVLSVFASLLYMCLGVIVVCATSSVIERAAGIPTPYWSGESFRLARRVLTRPETASSAP